MRDADTLLPEARLDPVVVALALALAARRPLGMFSSGGDGGPTSRVAPEARVRGRRAEARRVRPSNRKG